MVPYKNIGFGIEFRCFSDLIYVLTCYYDMLFQIHSFESYQNSKCPTDRLPYNHSNSDMLEYLEEEE